MCSFLFFFSFLETIFVLAMCHVSIAFYKQASRLFSIVIIGVNQTTGFFTSFLFIPLFYLFFDSFSSCLCFSSLFVSLHRSSSSICEGLSTQKNPRTPSYFFEKIPKNSQKSPKFKKTQKIPKI